MIDLRFLRPWARHMLAQELFTGYNQTHLPPRCALKVDIRKAYDTVEWDFLIAVMELFGFPHTFVKWIEECVTTPSFSVGLNRKPHGFFTGARGLWQGDPLSPYLFVLVMEVLQLIDQDELFFFHWKCDAARIFQLGFADDLLLFCRADMNSIGVFKTGLDRFAEWSGLKLNVQKSHLIISRSAQGLRAEMLEVLGFQEGVLSMRYLGLPLLSSRLTVTDCNPLLLKIDKRIAGWEGMALSYAARVQIIKSVLLSLSLYWSSAFILPKKVTNEIEKRLRTFLWKGTTNSGYAKGGLGFKDIAILNRALMTKKLCDIIRCDRTSIWVEWLYQGRLRDTSIWTIREHGGSWGWRKILRQRVFLRPMVDYQIGDGRTFYLWQDPWHYLGPLSVTFPRGPRLLRMEESARLSTVINEGEWQWPPITDFECPEITHDLPTIHGGEDRIIWRFDQGKPTTQALYRLFDPPGLKVGWSSLLSGSLKIPRYLFILWLAILGKLATTDKSWLAHLGPCILCNEGATETHDHLFFQCRFSRQDWITDIEWASQRWRGKHIVNISYRALLASCVYHIWRERNLRRFEHTERTPSTMALLIVQDIRQRILNCGVSLGLLREKPADNHTVVLCMTLGHSVKDCALNKSKPIKPPIAVYVPKMGPTRPPPVPDQEIIPPAREVDKQRDGREPPHGGGVRPSREEKGKEIVIYNTFDALHLLDDVDEMSRAIWNVRGLNKGDHQIVVKVIAAEFRLQFLGLLETRVRINNVATIQSFLLPHWKWFVDYGSVGNRVWIAWDENFVDVDVVECGTQFIHCIVYLRSLRESVAITVIYGATELADRRELWGSLETIAMQSVDVPWLIGGDFNAVRDLSEICGASRDIRMAMEEFNGCVQNASLLPLPMQGECLTPRTSDHSPLVLYGDNQQQYGGMFRFDNYLTQSSDFIPSVKQVWQHHIIGVPMYAVARKLKALKPVFREQRRNKGDLSQKVQLAKGFLEMAQVLVSSNRRDELFLQLEHCCQIVLAKAAKLEQIMLQQRAEMQWMKQGDQRFFLGKQGDQCSRVFFRKIAQRRSARRILQINDDHGVTHTEPEAIINEFITYYQNLLGGKPDVKQAVFDIAEDKAPGPDGYSSGFFKAAWPIVGQEVTSAMLDFFNTNRLLK
ncbi:UNVERIFIED_CONTAM: hypothetical protein Sindi_0942300 [Sesamum indicum]